MTPKTVWFTPHSGRVARVPDDILPYPEQVMDAFAAGVAASCAFNDRNKASKRFMISIHSSSFLGTILELGGFGILDDEKLAAVAKKIDKKYHERAQILADEHKNSFFHNAIRWLEHIENKSWTLNPQELNRTSTADRQRVVLILRELRLYGKEIKEFTLEKLREAMESLNKSEVPVISSNYIYPASNAGKNLRLSEKIAMAYCIQRSILNARKCIWPGSLNLMASIILDVKNELFG